MDKLLSRSKSLRLRPSRKDLKEKAVPGYDVSESRLVELEQGEGNKSRPTTSRLPNSVIRGGGFAIDSAGAIARPKTANEAMDHNRRKELMATGSPISVTSGQEIFNFPTPVRRPLTPLLDSQHNQEMGTLSVDTSEIGIALGSPRHVGIALGSPSHATHFQSAVTQSPAQGRLRQPSYDILTPASTPGRSQNFPTPLKSDGTENGRPKLSRWKSLFGRRPQPKTPQQHELRPRQQQESPVRPFDLNLQNYTSSPWQGEGPSTVIYAASPNDYNSTTHFDSPKKSNAGGRWGLGRSQTAPTRRGQSPIPPPKEPANDYEREPVNELVKEEVKSPMLDVDVPTSQMERYSVMFNTVLPKRSSSNLLARRQANIEKMKPLPVALKTLEVPSSSKRRATSPEPSPSYRLLIFPPESTKKQDLPHISTLHRPRPLRRSNTAPGALSPGLKDQSISGPLSPMSESAEYLEDSSERHDLTPTPSEPSTPTTPKDKEPINPFTNDRGSAAMYRSTDEPSWEMITIGKLAEPGDRVSGHVVVEGAEDQEDWRNPEPVQLKVARSVSVTKARRQLVGPRMGSIRSGERLVERKPLTPTLVELVDVPGRNRQSVRGMIEG